MIGFNCVHQPANRAPSYFSPLLGGGGEGVYLHSCAQVKPPQQKFLDLAVFFLENTYHKSSMKSPEEPIYFKHI